MTETDLFSLAHQTLMKADAERDRENYLEAIRLYTHARDRYARLSADYPSKDTDIVKFRTVYCTTQIESIAKEHNIPVRTSQSPSLPGSSMPSVQPNSSRPDSSAVPLVDTVALLEQAKQLLKTDKPDEAMQTLMQVLRGQPGNFAARILIGTAQCKAQRFSEAVTMMEALIEEDVISPHVYIVLGTAYFCLGRIPEAQKALQESIQLDDSIPEAYYDLTLVTLATKPLDIETARKHYKKSLELGGEKNPKLDFLLK